MRRAGMPEPAVEVFRHYLGQAAAGESGLIPEAEIEPIDVPAPVDDLPPLDRRGSEALDRTVILKLNGGLGTSMGMRGPKSLIEARDGLSFLDVICRQVPALRRRHGVRLPLVLMDSFFSRDESVAALAGHPEVASDVPPEFEQHREPKLRPDDLSPVAWTPDPSLEWCPPGHGDLYLALSTSGMLGAILDRGYRYAFVSNADNLGAVVEPRVLARVAAEAIPFAMEVVAGTEADRKGGHVARRRDGRLVLRESAQVPEDDAAPFEDYRRWRFYNTNNLWIDLRVLAAELDRRGPVLGLPLIVNRKTVDPADPATPDILQLETAAGSAISLFEGSAALLVPRSRFVPVKTTNDLLVLRSDVYRLTPEGLLEPSPERRGGLPPVVDLDPAFFRLLPDLEARFPAGPPSLAACERLVVRGDVEFGRGVVVVGTVEVEASGGRLRVPDGTVIRG